MRAGVGDALGQSANAGWVRPLQMGHGVGHTRETAGTMGAVVERKDLPSGRYLLSCAHVLAPPNAVRNDPIYQPALLDSHGQPSKIGQLWEWIPLEYGWASRNAVDVAIARLDAGISFRNEIDRLGRLSPEEILHAGHGTGTNMHVAKVGRTTGYTEGIVTNWTYEAPIEVRLDQGWTRTRYVDQLEVRPAKGYFTFSKPGDSGAIVVEVRTRRVIGMVVAGRFGKSVVTPIYRLLRIQGHWDLRLA